MFENEAQLHEATDEIVAQMLADGTAEKRFYTDDRLGKEYWNLITPSAFDEELVVVAVLGYPEIAGVWSFTLLSQSRVTETSMAPYFREFANHDIGLVAVNPNLLAPDIEGDSFVHQIERVIADVSEDKKLGFIGFSMGGRILIDLLEQHPGLLSRTAGLVLIDPFLPNRLKVENIRALLDNDCLLIASEGEETSPGEIASVLLQIAKISFPGIHGEMPNKALPQVVDFFSKRLP
ncbi:MAG: alpha/beta hydrolase [Planctomycetota bacterium]|jgi:pimeloyl-ACP methyl ester carboxylesterase